MKTYRGARLTLDRDVRLTPDQIIKTREACRRRVTQLNASIDRAKQAMVRGDRVQLGTYTGHLAERDRLLEVIEILDVARKQVAHQIGQQLGTV